MRVVVGITRSRSRAPSTTEQRLRWWLSAQAEEPSGQQPADLDVAQPHRQAPPTRNVRCNAVKLRSGPVEDIYLRRGVVFDDLVVGVFDVGVADGDSADHSRTGSEAAFR